MSTGVKDRRLAIVAIALLSAATIGIGISAWLFAGWSRISNASKSEASAAFDAALRATASPDPYIVVDPAGGVQVRRELEASSRRELRTLHLLAFDPATGRVYRVDFPWWFVRLKLSGPLNLGSLVASATGDWAHLDIKVTEEDLERRGAGVVLDHEPARGGRILLWSE
jgi:hypothetical protein